jgi:uncharacterized protein (DUF983 family)
MTVAAGSSGAFASMRRGFRMRCPHCGQGPIFRAPLKLVDRCSVCNEKLGDIRADDVPAYFTILLVGHIVVPLLLVWDRYDPPAWAELVVTIGGALALIWWLLPRVKGAFASLLWHLNMHTGAPA